MTNPKNALAEGRTPVVLLINSNDNPVARFDESSFAHRWHWLRVPHRRRWEDSLPDDSGTVDAVIVFAQRYRSDETLDLCRTIREAPRLSPVPLLVAVDRYEMPVAIRVREWPNADYVISPIEEGPLVDHLQRAIDSKEP